jgi:hypothetical protein
MYINSILLVLTNIILALGFIFSGRAILIFCYKDFEKTQYQLLLSMSYFMGLAFFLCFYRLLSLIISDAFFSLLIVLISTFLINILSFHNSKFIFSKKKWHLYIILFFSIFIIQLLYWTDSNADMSNPYSALGTLHSLRYINISKYIVLVNSIPIINQNYGQSLLVSAPLFLHLKASLLSLLIWLSISTTFLIIGTYGILRFTGIDVKSAIRGVLIVFLGNTALSLTHILVIDSGSPFLFIGYTDTIASVGTFIIFIIWLMNQIEENTTFSLTKTALFLLILVISWNIIAPQNIILIYIILFYFIIRQYFLKRTFQKNLIFISTLFFIYSIIGTYTGGMLSTKKIDQNIKIEGLMSLSKQNNDKIGIMPQLPYHFFNGEKWERANASLGTSESLKENLELYKKTRSIFYLKKFILKSWWVFELNFWILLKIMFFPLLGLFGLIILHKWKLNFLDNANTKINISILLIINFITLTSGLVFVFFVTLSGYKWELSRFLIPGIYLSMLSLGIVFSTIIKIFKCYKYPIIINYTLLLIIIFPPLYQSFYNIVINISNYTLFIKVVKIIFT